MENRRPSRRPPSAMSRPSTASSFNPITGEEYDEPILNRQRPEQNEEVVPTLNLGNLKDDGNSNGRAAAPQVDVSGYMTPGSTSRSYYSQPSQINTDRDTFRLADSSRIDTNWVTAPYHQVQDEELQRANERVENRTQSEMLETVLLDQLSRSVISDPEQDSAGNVTADDLYHKPGQSRGHIQRLHSSKVRTTGSATEQLLSQRVRFSARLLTRTGSDAVRELSGFFFIKENSLTVYQYKKLGQRIKVLPLIHRGVYNHMSGRKRGHPYTLSHIVTGKNLSFPVQTQSCIPDSARTQPTVTVRICDVDLQAKENIVLEGAVHSDRAKVWNKFHMMSPEEQHDHKILQTIQENIRSQIKKRSVKSYTGLSQHFRSADRSGDGYLDRFELKQALKDYHINLTDEEFNSAWTVVDENNDGVLDYLEFVRNFVGEMSEYRKTFVRKAFHKMDTSNRGEITIQQLMKFFNAAKHPLVQSGATSKVLLTEQFLSSWTHCQFKDIITYSEFEDYYEGLSIGIDDDLDFINIIRNCWGV